MRMATVPLAKENLLYAEDIIRLAGTFVTAVYRAVMVITGHGRRSRWSQTTSSTA